MELCRWQNLPGRWTPENLSCFYGLLPEGVDQAQAICALVLRESFL